MSLSRAEIVVYAVLAAGTWLLLALGIPAWVGGVAGLACALAFGYLHFRFPVHPALQPGKASSYATRVFVLGLVAALERYRANPAARQELAARDDRRRALGAPAA